MNEQKPLKVMAEMQESEKEYFVMLTLVDGAQEAVFTQTRRDAYETIAENIDNIDFNHDCSFVITSDCTLKERVTIVQFMRWIRDCNIYEDCIDVDDYLAEYESNIVAEQTVYSEMIGGTLPGSLNMNDILNGDIESKDL